MDKNTVTRANILKGAKEVFKEKGYRNASMQDIADATGISKSLLKYYFPRKENFSEVIMHDYMENIRNYVKSIEEVKDDAVIAYILTMLIYYNNIYTNEPIRRFNSEALLLFKGSDAGKGNNMDGIYNEIIKQYNLNLTEKLFKIRKIQIMGAQVYLLEAANKDESISDKDRFEAAIYSTLTLLGVSTFIYNRGMEKANEIFEKGSWEKFSML